MLIGAGFSLVGALIVARFMPARDPNMSEDDDRKPRELELEGPLALPQRLTAIAAEETNRT